MWLILVLDVYSNLDLTELDCGGNNLSKLDVSRNPKLFILGCSENNLSELDVSGNPELFNLFCSGNNLSELDISKNSKLHALGISDNKFTYFELPYKSQISHFACSGNCLKFSTIKFNEFFKLFINDGESFYEWIEKPENSWALKGDLEYVPQAIIPIPKTIYAGETVSQISSEFKVDGINTVYTWYEYDETQGEISTASLVDVTPTKSEKGVFTFGEKFVGKKLYCTMTNDVLPYLTLQTTVVEVVANDNPTAEPDTDEPTDPTPPADAPDNTTDTGKGPATGESIALTIVASCLAVISLAAIGAVVYKKKFAASAK